MSFSKATLPEWVTMIVTFVGFLSAVFQLRASRKQAQLEFEGHQYAAALSVWVEAQDGQPHPRLVLRNGAEYPIFEVAVKVSERSESQLIGVIQRGSNVVLDVPGSAVKGVSLDPEMVEFAFKDVHGTAWLSKSGRVTRH